MTLKIISSILQCVVVVALSPLQIGLIRATKARLEGRSGGRLLRPWREISKLMRKETIRYGVGSSIMAAASIVTLSSSLALALTVPSLLQNSIIRPDLFVIVSILTIGAISQGMVGLASGTSFGGMGSSRHLTLLALTEPTLLISIYALSIASHTTDLAKIIQLRALHPIEVVSPVGILVVASLVIAVLSETGRLPIDNPATHLELTMIHEAMTLESSGRDLAFQELASSIKLTVLTSLLANLLVPWPIDPSISLGIAPAIFALCLKIAVLSIALSVGETFLAKVRLFRVPELLAGSLAIAFIAVIVSGVTTI